MHAAAGFGHVSLWNAVFGVAWIALPALSGFPPHHTHSPLNAGLVICVCMHKNSPAEVLLIAVFLYTTFLFFLSK